MVGVEFLSKSYKIKETFLKSKFGIQLAKKDINQSLQLIIKELKDLLYYR